MKKGIQTETYDEVGGTPWTCAHPVRLLTHSKGVRLQRDQSKRCNVLFPRGTAAASSKTAMNLTCHYVAVWSPLFTGMHVLRVLRHIGFSLQQNGPVVLLCLLYIMLLCLHFFFLFLMCCIRKESIVFTERCLFFVVIP